MLLLLLPPLLLLLLPLALPLPASPPTRPLLLLRTQGIDKGHKVVCPLSSHSYPVLFKKAQCRCTWQGRGPPPEHSSFEGWRVPLMLAL